MTSTSLDPGSERPPAGQPVLSIDGVVLMHMIGAGYAWLKRHSHIVNALNVFPVPDGDTGTNMVLTMQSAWKAVPEPTPTEAGVVVQALANGAIRGARGNSGVILSQIFRGLAESLPNAGRIDAAQFAAAMRQARETAYKGVLKPVEGTILTVIREAADASGHAAAISPDLRFVLETTLQRAQQALANTPNLLPVLKQAGVVDAGGQGLSYLFEGMVAYLRGEQVAMPEAAALAPGPEPLPQPNLEGFEEEWGYDIQYLIYGEGLDENLIRQQLLDLGGESVVVGAAGPVVKVHVHGQDPGPFISFGAALGHLDDIVLENMTLQTLRRKGEWREPGAETPPPPPEPEPALPLTPAALFQPECAGIVAVVSGEGLRKVFESLGVCAFVSGGQTMNPSTEELVAAAEELPHEDVILLPNNKNVILAARQACSLCFKRMHLVETRSMPQGIAAMLGYQPTASAEENVAAMARAANDIHTAEVTTAVRDARFDGVQVRAGDIIGLIDGDLAVRGDSADEVVEQVLQALDPDGEYEIFTLYYGDQVSEAAAQALAGRLAEMFADHEIELLHGGQPHYHYLISVE